MSVFTGSEFRVEGFAFDSGEVTDKIEFEVGENNKIGNSKEYIGYFTKVY